MRLAHVVLLALPLLACRKTQEALDREDAEAQVADAAAVKRAEEAADAARVIDAARAAFIEKAAKACHVKPADYIPATKREMAKMCIVFVDAELKVPGSGTYPALPADDEGGLSTVDGCRSYFDSYVDAKNAFGATTRTRYRCTYDPKVGLASYRKL